MAGEVLLIAIAVFGISILFGQGEVEKYYKFLIWLIIAPLLLAIGCNHAVWFFLQLPLWMRILSILLVPFFVSALLRLLFPKAKWLQGLQTVVFQTLIFAVTFPLRFVWRAGQFFFRRESRTQKLNPYRPVVGGRPPLENQRREVQPRADIFD
jgi:FlaA1/EpsC-like NDP-sugar epimerase